MLANRGNLIRPKDGLQHGLGHPDPKHTNIQTCKHANTQKYKQTYTNTQIYKCTKIRKDGLQHGLGHPPDPSLPSTPTSSFLHHCQTIFTWLETIFTSPKLFSLRQNYFNFNFCLFGLKLLFTWIKSIVWLKTIVFLTQNYCLALNYCLLGSKQDCTIK